MSVRTNDAAEIISTILATEDYYEILLVERTATVSEIKKSYRCIARIIHPDKCSLEKCDDAFKKVGAAYKCLSGEESRQQYDLTGNDADDSPNYNTPFDNEMFAHMFANQSQQRASGIHTNIQLPPWLVTIMQIVPWKFVGPVLIVLSLFFFFKFILWILSLALYILPALYFTPSYVRWWLVLLILTLSLFGII